MNHVPLNRNFGGQPLGDHHDQHADYASGSTGKRLWRASQACRDAQETSGKHGEAKHFVLEALFKYGNINNWLTLHVWRVIKDTDLGNRKVHEKYTFCMRFSRALRCLPLFEWLMMLKQTITPSPCWGQCHLCFRAARWSRAHFPTKKAREPFSHIYISEGIAYMCFFTNSWRFECWTGLEKLLYF